MDRRWLYGAAYLTILRQLWKKFQSNLSKNYTYRKFFYIFAIPTLQHNENKVYWENKVKSML